MLMYDIIRYSQFDMRINDEEEDEEYDEIDCELIEEKNNICRTSTSSSLDEPESNVKSVGCLQSDESPTSPSTPSTSSTMKSFEDLSTETLLHLLLYVDDPNDIVALSSVNRCLHSFIQRFCTSLARRPIHVVEIRGSYDYVERKHSLVMNLTGMFFGSKRLWRGLCFKERSIGAIGIEMFASKIMFADVSVIRIDQIEITKGCLRDFTNFIEKMVTIGYPDNRKDFEDLELQINDCSFKYVSGKDISTFINKMISLGCLGLTINSVAFEDYIKVCKALSQTQIHLLELFRFHSDDITSSRFEPLQYILKPFCRLNRNTTKVVIDGIQIPLILCEWVMIQFCTTKFNTVAPPPIRIVLSIHRNYSRQELFDMLRGVRLGVEDARKLLNHRLNHVYLELGMYESDVHLTQNQHCVIDVKLMKPKNQNVVEPPNLVVT